MEIQNFEDYLIYEDGLIFSEKRNIIMKTWIKDGYERIQLCKNGKLKEFLIHRLVALHYVPKIQGKDCVDHIDGNKLNNHYSNLRWVTNIENMNNFRPMMKNNQSGHKNIYYDKSKNKFRFQKRIYGKLYYKHFKTLTYALCYKYIFILKRKANLLK